MCEWLEGIDNRLVDPNIIQTNGDYDLCRNTQLCTEQG